MEVWSYERIWYLFDFGFRASGVGIETRKAASLYIKQSLAAGRVGKEEARALIEAAPAVFHEMAKANRCGIADLYRSFPMGMPEFCRLLHSAKPGVIAASNRVPMNNMEWLGGAPSEPDSFETLKRK